MYKKMVLAGVVGALLTGAGHAADIQGGPRPYAAPTPFAAYSWAGPYFGLNLGYLSGSVTNNPTDPAGAAGGVQLGYNWQSGSLVFGGETDLQISGADDVLAPWKFSNPWFGTARGRVGYALNNILFYGTGGLAYGGLELEHAGLSETKSHIGWTLGLGGEVGLAQNWSAKVEYLYVDLADRTYFTGTSNGLESGLFRMGVNYHF
ncbi:MAG TPA: outer membrane protein [Xanthobacteraceae bacterium]|nr:outer membrane protein [Xanthobacteraceae bacterium]